MAAACLAAFLIAGCSSTDAGSPSPNTPSAPPPASTVSAPTSTPSPTETWSADQAAAIDVVNSYRAVSEKIGEDPAAFTEASMTSRLKKTAGEEVVRANVASFLSLKERGLRYQGSTVPMTTSASKASDVGYGVEVIVTRCIDQRALQVIDKSGREVGEEELGYKVPDFNLRQYTVQKRTGTSAFLVYGIAPAKGDCGP